MHIYKLERPWNMTADVMVGNFKESVRPIFRGIRCVESRSREEERWKMYDALHCGIFDHSANQLSIYGAVATWCEDFAQLIPGQTHVFMEKICGEGERPVVSKNGTARSGFFGTDTEEE